MKKILTLLLVSIFHISCFSQTIFPDDIQKIITDEKLFGNEILKFNEFYISNLDLKKINDSLFFNNKTKETLSLSRFKKTNKIYGIINYLTIGSHWNDFKMEYFWKRRWFRILPAYFFSIFLIVILSYITHTHFKIWEVIKTIFFVQNISHAPKSFFTESWSLSIEEWFFN